jgi:hypothetical protein
MKLSFNDLFTTTDDGNIIAKKDVRIGALMLPKDHPIHPNDPNLGISLIDWPNKSFEVDIQQDTLVIQQILDA